MLNNIRRWLQDPFHAYLTATLAFWCAIIAHFLICFAVIFTSLSALPIMIVTLSIMAVLWIVMQICRKRTIEEDREILTKWRNIKEAIENITKNTGSGTSSDTASEIPDPDNSTEQDIPAVKKETESITGNV